MCRRRFGFPVSWMSSHAQGALSVFKSPEQVALHFFSFGIPTLETLKIANIFISDCNCCKFLKISFILIIAVFIRLFFLDNVISCMNKGVQILLLPYFKNILIMYFSIMVSSCNLTYLPCFSLYIENINLRRVHNHQTFLEVHSINLSERTQFCYLGKTL